MAAGMSQIDVVAQLSDVNRPLYGYEYASHALVEALFLSYASWNGIESLRTDSETITDTVKYLDDLI